MNALQAFVASLAVARRQASADYLASQTDEHITIEPPVWCHRCGCMLADRGYLAAGTSTITAVCPACAARQDPDRRRPGERAVRELVEVTRLLAWQAQDSADTYEDRGWHETARVMRELAAAADNAIEALRINPQET